jgi:hypothetical protein
MHTQRFMTVDCPLCETKAHRFGTKLMQPQTTSMPQPHTSETHEQKRCGEAQLPKRASQGFFRDFCQNDKVFTGH